MKAEDFEKLISCVRRLTTKTRGRLIVEGSTFSATTSDQFAELHSLMIAHGIMAFRSETRNLWVLYGRDSTQGKKKRHKSTMYNLSAGAA